MLGEQLIIPVDVSAHRGPSGPIIRSRRVADRDERVGNVERADEWEVQLAAIAGQPVFDRGGRAIGPLRVRRAAKMSKAALNIAVVHLSSVYPNINWQLVHPGFVLTKMTKGIPGIEKIGISPEVSAEALINLPVPKGVSHVSYDGQTLGW